MNGNKRFKNADLELLRDPTSEIVDKSLHMYVEGALPMQVIVPWLICIKVDETYETKQFSIFKEWCPPQENGLFTLNYIEFLLAGKHVSLILPEYMREWRNKLAADIFCQHFDP